MSRSGWITVGFLALLLFAALTAHAGAWYSSDWDYRKEITVNNTGSELTNYQVMFTVNRSSGTDSGSTVYLNSKCEADYDDIRFVGADDTTAWDYWIESSSATVATIWVEVPSLPTGDTTGYLYYGNAAAAAVSDGDTVFDFFDDFPGSSIDTAKWTVSGSPTVTGGTLIISPGKSVVGKTNFGVNYIVRVRMKSSAFGPASIPHFGFRATGDGAFTWVTDPGGIFCIYTLVGASGTREGISSNPSIDTYYTCEISRRSTTSVLFSVSGFSSVQSTTNIPSASVPITLATTGAAAPTVTYDWILIRKYAATEPTVSAWGSEEARPTVAAFSANVTTGNAPMHVGFTDASTGVGLSNWTWDFQNDDTPDSYDQNPAFTYTIAGVYTVNLTVTGTGGTDSEIKVDYITVTNATPTPTPTPTVTPTGTPPVQPAIPEGRIPPLAFVVLSLITCGCVVYTFVDNENRNYLHIGTAAVAMLLSFLLAVFLITGGITVDFVVELEQVTVNESVLSTYDVQHIAITDIGFAYFFVFLGVVMLIITMLAVIEVIKQPQRRLDE